MTTDRRLAEIREKVTAGVRLSSDDGLALEASTDLFTLGELANLVRERKNGNVTYYNVNQHLNPTNVCVYRCAFCSFRADLKSPKGYVMSDEQILQRAREATQQGATELHIVGGLHHQLPYEWYLGIIRNIHREFPALHLKAWTAVEWDWFERLTKRPTRELLAEMKEAGLGSLPGGGAEIFHDEIRSKICDYKADAEQWLRVHREWHEMGGRSNATMLYGHIERAEHRLDHLVRLRELQDVTGGFQTFIPLAFHPENNTLGQGIPKPSGLTDLKVMAVSRLMLDNFPHVKAYWQMLGAKIAQVAQSWGADDIDGTVVHETIYHAAGSNSPQELGVSDLRRLIEEAGRVPVERDTLYNEVVREPGTRWKTGRKLVALNWLFVVMAECDSASSRGTGTSSEAIMKCQQCPKAATLHVTASRENTAVGECHLCEECGRAYLNALPPRRPNDGRRGGPHNDEGEFRLDVERVVITEVDDHQVIVFREVGGPRGFPLVIGIFEATTIDRRLRQMPTPRPLTHDAWLLSLTAVGVRVVAAGIDALKDHIYFASLRLAPPGHTGRPVAVDIRPSDAVAAALTAGVPLFIPDRLLDEVSSG